MEFDPLNLSDFFPQPPFGRALYRILRKIHPSLQISQKAMGILSDMCLDQLDRFAQEANHFRKVARMETLRIDHFKYAAKSVIRTPSLREWTIDFAGRKTLQFVLGLPRAADRSRGAE